MATGFDLLDLGAPFVARQSVNRTEQTLQQEKHPIPLNPLPVKHFPGSQSLDPRSFRYFCLTLVPKHAEEVALPNHLIKVFVPRFGQKGQDGSLIDKDTLLLHRRSKTGASQMLDH